jgi:hypothetical protein
VYVALLTECISYYVSQVCNLSVFVDDHGQTCIGNRQASVQGAQFFDTGRSYMANLSKLFISLLTYCTLYFC